MTREAASVNVAPPDCVPPHTTGAAIDFTLETLSGDVLIDAMTKAGFANLRSEWWHWSYGDRVWAYYAKQPHAIYGSR